MTKHEFLLLLDQIVEVDPGTLSESDSLESIETWDSMAIIVFQAEVDEKLGVVVEPTALAQCRTIGDLCGLLGDKITAA